MIVYQGERIVLDITVLNNNTGDPLVLTGSTIHAALFSPQGVIYKSSSEDGYDDFGYGIEITDAGAGEVSWVIPEYATRTLAEGRAYYYQFWRSATDTNEALCEPELVYVKKSLFGL